MTFIIQTQDGDLIFNPQNLKIMWIDSEGNVSQKLRPKEIENVKYAIINHRAPDCYDIIGVYKTLEEAKERIAKYISTFIEAKQNGCESDIYYSMWPK